MRLLVAFPFLLLGLGCVCPCKGPGCCDGSSAGCCVSQGQVFIPTQTAASNGYGGVAALQLASAPGQLVPQGTAQSPRYALAFDWAHVQVPVLRLTTLPEHPQVMMMSPQAILPASLPVVASGAMVLPAVASASHLASAVVPAVVAPTQWPAPLVDAAASELMPAPAQGSGPAAGDAVPEIQPSHYVPDSTAAVKQEEEELKRQLDMLERQLGGPVGAPEGEQPKP